MAEARAIRERIRNLEIRPVYHQVGYESISGSFIEGIKELTEAEARGEDDKLKEIALKVVTNYENLASNNKIQETGLVTSERNWYRDKLEECRGEKAELKKDNEALTEKYFKLQGQSEYVTVEFEKLMNQLTDNWKKTQTP